MKSYKSLSVICAVCMAAVGMYFNPATIKADDDPMNMYQNSDFIEKEQPELTEETKQLISVYQKNPSEENYQNLRNVVIKNYEAVLAKKEAKLAELREETNGKPGGEEKIAEMEEIVQEMYDTYDDRINNNMLRFTDSRLLQWSTADAYKYDYVPVMGAGEDIYISRTQVTNEQYAQYINATGAGTPENWVNGTYPSGEEQYPVNYVSYEDAKEYCAWLTENDENNAYRLPTESEWELAAGHMPKDADFNCGVNDGRTSVYQYENVTRGAHGAIDFWGNVWEWTSAVRSNLGNDIMYEVKGGAWNSDRTDCRTEYHDEIRAASQAYEDVGFRVIKVVDGKENVSDSVKEDANELYIENQQKDEVQNEGWEENGVRQESSEINELQSKSEETKKLTDEDINYIVNEEKNNAVNNRKTEKSFNIIPVIIAGVVCTVVIAGVIIRIRYKK